MRFLAAGLAGIALLLGAGGCGLDPFGDETVPPLEDAGIRITEGVGTSAAYRDTVEAVAGNVVQLRALIGDGKTLVATADRGPTEQVVLSFALEGPERPLAAVTVRSRDGEPISIGEPFEFDPGYVGVEHHSDDRRVELRLAVPRLTGTPQGQVTFTFKMKVLP